METSKSPTIDPTIEGSQNMEKVRELLFGSELKKHEQDVAQIQARFDSKLNELRKHVHSGFESLKNMLTKQNTLLNGALHKIESSSDEKYILTGKKISESNNRNLKTFESMSETQTQALYDLRVSLKSDIEKVSTDTQRDVSILREIKLNRNMLGKIFSEAGDKLTLKA